jgi:hypothetical protein
VPAHYYETLVFSDSGQIRGRVKSLSQPPFHPNVSWQEILTEGGVELPRRPLDSREFAASVFDVAQSFGRPRWECDEFVRHLVYSDIITVERSPGVVANLGTFIAAGGGGFLMGGPVGGLVGVVLAAPALIVISVVKGTATGAERAAEKVSEEVAEAWLRRVLRLPNEPDDDVPPS